MSDETNNEFDVPETPDDGSSEKDEGVQTGSDGYSEEPREPFDEANPHGAVIEANGGEGTIVRTAYLGREM